MKAPEISLQFLADIQRANGNIQMQRIALNENSVGATL